MRTEPNSLDRLSAAAPFSFPQAEKRALLTSRIRELTRMHYERCDTFRHLMERAFGSQRALEFTEMEDAPFLPVSLFKTHELRSVGPEKVVKVLTSSGTSDQTVSRVYLDAETAKLQSDALVKIMQHFLGVQRRPLIILDCSNVLRDRYAYSARGAAIMGMLLFGRRPFYALKEDFSLDVEGLESYLATNRDLPPIFFGVTYVVWQYFVEGLARAGQKLKCPAGSILMHTGGWKKLLNRSVSPEEYRRAITSATEIEKVVGFYGMAEQVGSVYCENDRHLLQASNYSEIIIRDTNTLKPLPPGQPGLVQVLSSLPVSYPGHSILTEDLGVIRDTGDSSSEMHGQHFELLGRLPEAELRGCSDTFAELANR